MKSQENLTVEKNISQENSSATRTQKQRENSHKGIDWVRVARNILVSRALDNIEEKVLVPKGLITYQFSARGHDLAQSILGEYLNNSRDAATVYYRSRPFMLAQGLTPKEALLSTMGKSGGVSEGRDIGVVHNLPKRSMGTVLPTSGDVGAQYTPAVGFAQAIDYNANSLGNPEWHGAIAVALGGDASCATNGFWSALTIATTQCLPFLFFIEDNGYGISVTGNFQTPGGNIAENLKSFKGLTILNGSGTDPYSTNALIQEAVENTRNGNPTLIRLEVPRLCGHSFVDTQTYKPSELLDKEIANDPLPKLKEFLISGNILSETEWSNLETEVEAEVASAAEAAVESHYPNTKQAHRFVFYEKNYPQTVGGVLAEIGEKEFAKKFNSTTTPQPTGARINLIEAVRKTLTSEMQINEKILVFGEDVGAKGGVHGATVDMQHNFGSSRVFDTSLNEEGIIGRAVGMAVAGLLPVPEIQFRKYADPAHEQITDCGTIRWRTANKFAAPMVVRIPIGFGKKSGDPWHSVSAEAAYAHLIGWQIVIPSNAEDAVGLLRSALRGNNPVMFLEHRAMLDSKEARRVYPGDNFILPFGRANVIRQGEQITLVTWGEMVHRATEAVEDLQKTSSPVSVEIIDLRTIIPWDKEAVFDSIKKTGRCIVLHEDNITCGFGSEISATIMQECFSFLDAPVQRLATFDCPIPYNPGLMSEVTPTVSKIKAAIERLCAY